MIITTQKFITIHNAAMKKTNILLIFGTRPEAIKMAPVYHAFKANPDAFDVKICVTAQHREMLDQVLQFFDLKPDFDLNLMKPGQTLFDITANGLKALEQVFNKISPDVIFVQGDTTTAFIGALAGFYKKIHVAHVEAGLRSQNKFSPYPEEMNRLLAGRLADIHFSPTKQATENLKREGIKNHIYEVGNTVIDALFEGLEIIEKKGLKNKDSFFKNIDFSRRIILVTGHRRESFGKPFENICEALAAIATRFQDVEIVYPVHLNPQVQEPVKRILSNYSNIHLIAPLEYPYLLWLMNRAYLVLTDSGGIQEEAPSLGKPVLVMRDVTERTEGIDAGTAKLVGTDKEKIIMETSRLLENRNEYAAMANAVNPYGDGTASQKIVEVITNEYAAKVR